MISRNDVLLVIEIAIVSGFWIFIFGGASDGFNTIIFFEPNFTYGLIVISIVTGMLIDLIYTRLI
jgi:hypothetical protein